LNVLDTSALIDLFRGSEAAKRDKDFLKISEVSDIKVLVY